MCRGDLQPMAPVQWSASLLAGNPVSGAQFASNWSNQRLIHETVHEGRHNRQAREKRQKMALHSAEVTLHENILNESKWFRIKT